MVLRSIGGFVGLSESEMQDQSVGGLLIALLLLPFRLAWGFIIFMVFAWTTSRSGRAFVFAVPAMCFAVLYIAIIWAVGFKGNMKAFGLTAVRYSKASDINDEAFDPDAALLYAKKMVSTDPENSVYSKYELGLSYERLGKFDEAYNLIRFVAPDVKLDASEDELGHSEAYYWLAGYYADEEKSDVPEDQRRELARKNMELAYLANSENVFAVLGLAGMNRDDSADLKAEALELRNQGEAAEAAKKEELAEKLLDKAVKFLDEAIALPLVSPRQLYASNVLIDILQERGENRDAEVKGLQFIGRYEGLAERSPDVLPLWISIVKVCIQIGDFDRGEAFILRGYQLAEQQEARVTLAKLAAQIEVEKAKSFEDMDDEEQFVSRLYALSDAINTDVHVPEAYGEVLYYIDGFDEDDEKDDWLRDSLLGNAGYSSSSDKKIPVGIIHLYIGTREILFDAVESGKNHWEIAAQQFPYTPFAINNLVRKYVDERKASNETRDKLLAVAIEMFPQEPLIYASRGRYYLEDEAYEKAIEDLEFANTRVPNVPVILKDLLVCYEKTGNQEKADEVQQQIDVFESKIETDSFLTPFSSSTSVD